MLNITMAVVLGTLLMCSLANASETWFVGDKPVKKVEALISLVREPNTPVVKCVQQELSEKGTLRNVKKQVR